MQIDVLKLLWTPLKLRRCFEDHVILVELCVEGADLTLSERVIERRVNLVRGNIHARGCGPVNDEILG